MPLSPQIRDPKELCPCIRKKYEELQYACIHTGNFETTTIETLRKLDRQAFYVAKGVSWTMNSKHLPQAPKGLALAFDLAPTEYLTEPNWNPSGDYWEIMGGLGKNVGLKWGGDWGKRDMPHFQLDQCKCDNV